jgi:4'-phosphopantetheinyl transferase superfamily
MLVTPKIYLLPLSADLSRNQRSALSRLVAEACLRDEAGVRLLALLHAKVGVTRSWASRSTAAGAPAAISFSYCDGWAGFAYANVKCLGFDIEPKASVSARVARRVMSPSDLEIFDRVSREEQSRVATRHWTSAEAISKAAGEGLPMMLRRQLNLRCASHGKWNQYQFAASDTDAGVTCALATDGSYDLCRALIRMVVLEWRCFVNFGVGRIVLTLGDQHIEEGS